MRAPSIDEFADLAEAAFARLPAEVRAMTGDVAFHVQDFAEDEVLNGLGLEDPFELTGLYSGVHIGHREALGPAPEVSRVFLYRRPILDEWCERGDVPLEDLVFHVLVHEIGHHFGLSDEQIDAIEASA